MGLNEVFKKVADIKSNATELASHEVELASIKDIKELITNLKNIEKDAEKVAGIFESKMKEALASYKTLISERNAIYTWVNNQAPAVLNDFNEKAKELGLSIDNVPEVKEVKQLIILGKDLVKALDGYREPNTYK